MTTAKEFVLESFPNAVCEKMTGSLYYIYKDETGVKILGSAASAGSAWVNAKNRLLEN